jgi:hypothetical protein
MTKNAQETDTKFQYEIYKIFARRSSMEEIGKNYYVMNVILEKIIDNYESMNNLSSDVIDYGNMLSCYVANYALYKRNCIFDKKILETLIVNKLYGGLILYCVNSKVVKWKNVNRFIIMKYIEDLYSLELDSKIIEIAYAIHKKEISILGKISVSARDFTNFIIFTKDLKFFDECLEKKTIIISSNMVKKLFQIGNLKLAFHLTKKYHFHPKRGNINFIFSLENKSKIIEWVTCHDDLFFFKKLIDKNIIKLENKISHGAKRIMNIFMLNCSIFFPKKIIEYSVMTLKIKFNIYELATQNMSLKNITHDCIIDNLKYLMELKIPIDKAFNLFIHKKKILEFYLENFEFSLSRKQIVNLLSFSRAKNLDKKYILFLSNHIDFDKKYMVYYLLDSIAKFINVTNIENASTIIEIIADEIIKFDRTNNQIEIIFSNMDSIEKSNKVFSNATFTLIDMVIKKNPNKKMVKYIRNYVIKNKLYCSIILMADKYGVENFNNGIICLKDIDKCSNGPNKFVFLEIVDKFNVPIFSTDNKLFESFINSFQKIISEKIISEKITMMNYKEDCKKAGDIIIKNNMNNDQIKKILIDKMEYGIFEYIDERSFLDIIPENEFYVILRKSFSNLNYFNNTFVLNSLSRIITKLKRNISSEVYEYIALNNDSFAIGDKIIIIMRSIVDKQNRISKFAYDRICFLCSLTSGFLYVWSKLKIINNYKNTI